MKISISTVDEVRRRADIVEVVQASGVKLKRRGSSWSGLCPFHAERSGSFHAWSGKGWRCFGCGEKGDSIGYVMKREGLEFGPAVERLAAQFAVPIVHDRPLNKVPAQPAAPSHGAATTEGSVPVFVLPAGMDEKAARRAIARQMRWEAQRAAEARLEEAWRKGHLPDVQRRPLRAMSAVVRTRWQAGVPQVQEMAALAQERGWPVAWVHWLVDEGLIAWPELPWSTQRMVAWRVDAPRMGAGSDERSYLSEVVAIGYHQRWWRGAEKNWVYVPWWAEADEGRVLADWRAEMVAAELARGADRSEGLVPALPFFCGGWRGVRLLVISEGQWDAATFAGAMGWMGEGAWPVEVAVMGARGATGVDTLLAYWADWLRHEAPEVLVLADNDKAGRKWDTPEPTEPGVLGSPTFAQKLEAAGAARVVISRVRPEIGKDFNDYWKARRPGAAALHSWLQSLGLIGADGGYGRVRRRVA